jgi:hypothetical protein
MRPRIGRLIPATIAIALLLDAATRLIPIELFTFRAWEALVVAHAATGPFEPNRVYVNPLSYGDLARSQRYRAVRQRRLEYFSTDSWGYRNTVQPSNRPVTWLLLGDSFGVSSGVSDAATLASQLARWSGESVYNASASFPLALGDARFTAGRIGMKNGLVVYEYMERWDLPAIDAAARRRIFGEGPPRAARTFIERLRVLQQQAAVSRMNILAGWGWDALATRVTNETVSSDASDPVPGELPTLRFALANGDTMLFYTKDVEVTRTPDRIIAPQYLITLRTELQKLNLDLGGAHRADQLPRLRFVDYRSGRPKAERRAAAAADRNAVDERGIRRERDRRAETTGRRRALTPLLRVFPRRHPLERARDRNRREDIRRRSTAGGSDRRGHLETDTSVAMIVTSPEKRQRCSFAVPRAVSAL